MFHVFHHSGPVLAVTLPVFAREEEVQVLLKGLSPSHAINVELAEQGVRMAGQGAIQVPEDRLENQKPLIPVESKKNYFFAKKITQNRVIKEVSKTGFRSSYTNPSISS